MSREFSPPFEDPADADEISAAIVLDESEICVSLPPESRRRRLFRKLGATVAGGLIAVGVLVPAFDSVSDELVYPNNDTTISIVPEASHIPEGGEEWVVFGGLGQVDSATAAKQFYDEQAAAGVKEAVSSVHYKNQGIDDSDADVLASYIKQRHIKHLGIVGVSMGTPTALYLLSKLKGEAADVEVDDIVAYSSPATGDDAWQSEALHKAAEIARATGYKPGLLSKAAYNFDIGRLLSPDISGDERKAQWDHGVRETLNDCSGRLWESQIIRLDEANQTDLTKIHFGKDMNFMYMEGTAPDDTVNDDSAIQHFISDFNQLKDEAWNFVKVLVQDAGHADTARSAEARGKFLQEQQMELRERLSGVQTRDEASQSQSALKHDG